MERQLRPLGSTKVNRNGLECPQCLHCSVVMSNASLRLSKLTNHRDKKHPRRKDNDVDALSAKRARYDLASNTLPPRLMEVMDVAVKVINFIRARAKNHRLFQLLAKEMGEQHVGLLFSTKVRWLSRGKCLSRLYELRVEVEIFLRDNENNLHFYLHNEEFVMMLAYLADVFGRLNEMNLSLQGRNVTVSNVLDKLAGLSARMGVWQARIKAGSTSSFPFLDEHLETKRIELPLGIKTCIIGHLEIVSAEFRSYFDDAPLPVPWHKDPFKHRNRSY